MRFIGLDNYENINCYFITVLQLLHSSELLTNAILQGAFNEVRDKLKVLFEPVYVYAEMKGTDSEIRENIKRSMHLNPPLIRDGYNWISLLNIYYFPVIYCILGIEGFYTVLQEMSIEKRMLFSDILLENYEMIPKTEEIALRPYVETYRSNIYEIIRHYNPDYFRWKITALEMYIDEKYGHVAPVLNENGILYIFDDHTKETIYDHFIAFHRKLSDKLRLYYFDSGLAKLYNHNLQVPDDASGFVENNFSHVFRHFNKYINRPHELPILLEEEEDDSCVDHDITHKCRVYKIWCLLLSFLVCILIVVITYIVCSTRATNRIHGARGPYKAVF